MGPVEDCGDDVGVDGVELLSVGELVVLLVVEVGGVLDVDVLDAVVDGGDDVDVDEGGRVVEVFVSLGDPESLVSGSSSPVNRAMPPMQHRRITSTIRPAIAARTPPVSRLRGGGVGSGRSSSHDPPC